MTGRFAAVARQQGSAASKAGHEPRPEQQACGVGWGIALGRTPTSSAPSRPPPSCLTRAAARSVDASCTHTHAATHTQVTSGQAVTDATTLHNGVSASGITDYQVLALPDGSWAVHVTGWDWEKPVTCKAPRGLLRVKCLYSNETVDYGDIYYPAWWRAGRLVLQQVS